MNSSWVWPPVHFPEVAIVLCWWWWSKDDDPGNVREHEEGLGPIREQGFFRETLGLSLSPPSSLRSTALLNRIPMPSPA